MTPEPKLTPTAQWYELPEFMMLISDRKYSDILKMIAQKFDQLAQEKDAEIKEQIENTRKVDDGRMREIIDLQTQLQSVTQERDIEIKRARIAEAEIARMKYPEAYEVKRIEARERVIQEAEVFGNFKIDFLDCSHCGTHLDLRLLKEALTLYNQSTGRKSNELPRS